MLDIWRLEEQTSRNDFPLLERTLAFHPGQPTRHSGIHGSHVYSKTKTHFVFSAFSRLQRTHACMCNLLINVGVFIRWTVHSPNFNRQNRFLTNSPNFLSTKIFSYTILFRPRTEFDELEFGFDSKKKTSVSQQRTRLFARQIADPYCRTTSN